MKEDRRYNYPLRVDGKLIEKSRYIANYNGRSLNKQIEQLLLLMVKNFEAKNGEIETSKMEEDDNKA